MSKSDVVEGPRRRIECYPCHRAVLKLARCGPRNPPFAVRSSVCDYGIVKPRYLGTEDGDMQQSGYSAPCAFPIRIHREEPPDE
jgi:hypothetical protein